jgi:hypothetical protein
MRNNNSKYSYVNSQSRGKFFSLESFQKSPNVADLRLKCCILEDNAKNKASGRKYQVLGQMRRRLPALPSSTYKV